MKAQHTFGIDFIIRLSKNDKTSALIFARITVNGDRKEISLKENINTADWDSSSEMVKGKSEKARSINRCIDEARFRIKEKYKQLEEKGCTITAQAVKEAYLGTHSMQKPKHTLVELIKFHYKIEGEKLRQGTMKNYVATEEYLKRFIKHKFKTDDFDLNKIDYEFITEFEHYVRKTPLKEHDPCKGNGVMKHLERFKKMIRWARQLNWISANPIADYKLSFKRYKRQKLTIDELMRIENHQFNLAMQNYVKDLFLFSCYTGLSYIDAINLRPEDLEINSEGRLWCKVYRRKSDELSPVPILKAAYVIIEKYKNDQGSKNRNAIFPYVSNQEVNRSLKVIGEVCRIDKYMSFHLARHTFATAITLKNGVPIETVSKMLGHSKITTTQIYTEVDEEKIGGDMTEAENRIEKRKSILKAI